jgi:hypothetical protein
LCSGKQDSSALFQAQDICRFILFKKNFGFQKAGED